MARRRRQDWTPGAGASFEQILILVSKEKEAQRYYLDLMLISPFNDFDSYEVVGSLLTHRNLWQSCFMTREGIHIILRDLPRQNNVDTLFILPRDGKEETLISLARTWSASEVSWVKPPTGPQRILRVFWD